VSSALTLPGRVLDARVEDGRLYLHLTNGLGAIDAGRLEILAHLSPLRLPPKSLNRLEVVFEELIANVVRHGFTPGSDQSILVTVTATPQQIDLVFEDDGIPFDPLARPEPAPFTTLASSTVGGRGLPMVRRFTSSFAYEAMPTAAIGSEVARRGFFPVNRVSVSIPIAG
jgi:anti-sigma regulatory factor (Ser/Thr protein kinase)